MSAAGFEPAILGSNFGHITGLVLSPLFAVSATSVIYRFPCGVFTFRHVLKIGEPPHCQQVARSLESFRLSKLTITPDLRFGFGR